MRPPSTHGLADGPWLQRRQDDDVVAVFRLPGVARLCESVSCSASKSRPLLAGSVTMRRNFFAGSTTKGDRMVTVVQRLAGGRR